ncbi:MAG: metallophosphoesterase [Deltaproteobacteria bacterium]|nr:metallophosphoesterase [Deltaproteobacteria bacterium]MBW2724415.1 metallophosphoesterase [Deltaproteobacteria bacterium]
MNSRMLRMLTLAILLVTLSEVLILHWAGLALRGSGFGLTSGLLAALALGAINVLLFPAARRRTHAKGLGLIFSRVWILGSVSALMTGIMLAIVFTGFFAIGQGDGGIFGSQAAHDSALVWLGGAVVLLGLGAGLWGSTVGNHRVRVDSILLSLPSFPAHLGRLDVVHITDLHIGPLLQPDRLKRFVDRINGLAPDLIVITGDIFDFDPRYIEDGCRELAKLEARHGVFAVLGNHDHYTGTESVVAGLARFTSIRLLRDEWERIDIGGAGFVIAGLEDPQEGWMDKHAESPVLERFAAEIPKDLPRLLLAHRPSFFHHAQELGFPLVLAGHTHGGQVALPFATNANPSRMIADRTRGLFHRGESTMYVNRGLGMAGLPLRLNCPREIALIQLSA